MLTLGFEPPGLTFSASECRRVPERRRAFGWETEMALGLPGMAAIWSGSAWAETGQ